MCDMSCRFAGAWIQRLKTVWNPSMRRKSMVAMDSKRK